LFNQACNITNRYLSSIKLEILYAQKGYDIAKATVIIDKMPELIAQLVASGMKNSEDVRNAFIARDQECQDSLDRLNTLLATEAFLDAKSKSFVRAYNAVKAIAERRPGRAAEVSLSTSEGSLDGEYNADLMVGKSRWSNR
jgi:galactokinase